MFDLEPYILVISLLIIFSVLLAKWSNNTGFPHLLLFLIVGMMGGSEGIGGIHFDDPELAKNIGVGSLVLILFSGGFDTNWKKVRSAALPAVTLATFGVLITALLLGLFVYFIMEVPIYQAFLLGSVVASTDAAAVFSILRGKNLALNSRLKSLLELESGSNDPMAIFLTISFIQLINTPESSFWRLLLMFVSQMGIGLIFGLIAGKGLIWLINKIKFPIEGFYAVLVLAFVFFIYSISTMINGSGFLAVYVAGIVLGNSAIVFKRSLFRFFDGFAWLAQITMFITLGLLVFPSKLLPIIPVGLLISFFLMVVTRPLAIFASIIPYRYTLREKIFISWVGLRGAVPIILATFPFMAGIPEADLIFNIVFFIVLTSAVFQGWTIPFTARKLRLLNQEEEKLKPSIEFSEGQEGNMVIFSVSVPDNPELLNKPLVELSFLKGSLIVLIMREGNYVVPSGGTTLQSGDRLQILTDRSKVAEIKEIFSKPLI